MNIKIITAASESYSKSLLALIGSLNVNWPNHPPIEVYDIGLDEPTLKQLNDNAIVIKKVPPFCAHWRKYFTWKIWCWNDSDADILLYLDAGNIVLRPLDELLDVIEKVGYAVFPNYRLLEEEASEQACHGCGLEPDFRKNKTTLAGNMVGFNKTDPKINALLNELYKLSFIESNLKPFGPTHRYDQALLSLIVYKSITNPLLIDGDIYLGNHTPIKVPGQKVWACRRNPEASDISNLQKYVNNATRMSSYMPGSPKKLLNHFVDEFAYQIERIYGIGKADIGQIMLRQSLGKPGLFILRGLIKLIRFYRILVYGKKNALKIPSIYDGVKD